MIGLLTFIAMALVPATLCVLIGGMNFWIAALCNCIGQAIVIFGLWLISKLTESKDQS